MQRSRTLILVAVGAVAAIALATFGVSRRPSPSSPATASAEPRKTGPLTIDYPLHASVFPPEFPSPTWQWRDESSASSWQIEVRFGNGAPALRAESTGEPLRVGQIDPRTVGPTNEPPALTPTQAAAHTWTPSDADWAVIKTHSVEHPAKVVITGRGGGDGLAASRGEMEIRTSKDPVGAPIFYRDVPLMPSENEQGVIKPLAPKSVPLIAWRLRNVAEKESHVVMQGLHTCANCHSFSGDGKTLGMDMDGPQNDKGLYALADVKPEMTIGRDELIEWSNFRGKMGSKLRVGFMSRVSPDGQRVVTTVNDPGIDQSDYERRKNPIDLVRNYYVENFTNYRFLQVFFPTRGVLAWYSRGAKRLEYLPGADDPKYVHANAVWSPDGKYLVFLRGTAMDPYAKDKPRAKAANDPNETQMRFDLYRIPFNEGKGGKAEPIEGASNNGMSNSFPKISPDGRFIVFVQAKNGLLMRPDSQLFIVPAAGGRARRMTCNTPLMNSWHSFSPNGRWLVFSSKSRSPYTQMFLTHIDEQGNDTPAILIENSTAANRAVNIPEFVNIPPETKIQIATPAADFARHVDLAAEAMAEKKYEVAARELGEALALSPEESTVHNNLGVALTEMGKLDEALDQFEKALGLNPKFSEAYNNFGEALSRKGELKSALEKFQQAVTLDPEHADAQKNLGTALARTGNTVAAVVHFRKAVEIKPDAADARRDLGHALAETGNLEEASRELERATELSGGKDALALYFLSRVYADLRRIPESQRLAQRALAVAKAGGNQRLVQAIIAQ